MVVVDFESNIKTRIKRKDLRDIQRIIRKDNYTYNSLSHYVRCAIIRLNQEEKKRLKIK